MTILERMGKRRILLGGGVAALVVGLSLFAVGMTQVLDGDDPVEAVRATREPTASPSATPTPGATTAVPTPLVAPLRDQPYNIRIGKIGVDAPVETYGLDEQQIPEVPVGPGAAGTVAWYDFSAQPGTGSNAVFAGHVTWNGQGVFYNLKTVAAGDEVELVGVENGARLVYKVTEVFQVDPADPESLKVMHGTPEDVITIITCDGAYAENSDPVFGGEYSHRLVVRASLESVTPPAGAG